MSTDLEAGPKAYTLYHPRWYRPRVSTYWWLGRWPYLKFILRELSSIFVAWTVVLMLLAIAAIAHGPAAYGDFLETFRNPALVVLNVISLGFVLFHTITWFNLSPHAMVVRVRGQRVPNLLISGPNYVLWLAMSAAIIWLLVR
jgi:succinate dehydrogenase subunit C